MSSILVYTAHHINVFSVCWCREAKNKPSGRYTHGLAHMHSSSAMRTHARKSGRASPEVREDGVDIPEVILDLFAHVRQDVGRQIQLTHPHATPTKRHRLVKHVGSHMLGGEEGIFTSCTWVIRVPQIISNPCPSTVSVLRSGLFMFLCM